MTSPQMNVARPTAPWEGKEASYGARLGLTFVTIVLLVALVISAILALLVGMSLINGTGKPGSETANLIAVVVASVVCIGSLVAVIAIQPYMQGPARFKPSYSPVAATALGQIFEVRFHRYLWGRSMRGKGTVEFTPDGLTITGHLEPNALFQLGVVVVLTVLPAIIFNVGLGIIPALIIAYYIGRKQISRGIPYASLGNLEVKGRQATVRCDGIPKSISFAVASVDGERLYRELLLRFPTALGGWQG